MKYKNIKWATGVAHWLNTPGFNYGYQKEKKRKKKELKEDLRASGESEHQLVPLMQPDLKLPKEGGICPCGHCGSHLGLGCCRDSSFHGYLHPSLWKALCAYFLSPRGLAVGMHSKEASFGFLSYWKFLRETSSWLFIRVGLYGIYPHPVTNQWMYVNQILELFNSWKQCHKIWQTATIILSPMYMVL